jgi:protein TonB
MNASLTLPDFHVKRWAPPRISRNLLVIGTVLALHVAALWAMQSGLLRRAVEVVIPAEILSDLIDPPRPKVVPPPQPTKVQAPQRKSITPPAPPQLQAIKDTETTPNAPTGVTTPPAPLPPITAPVQAQSAAPPAAPAAPPAPPKMDLPSSDADYLQNPRPAYPSMSKRLGEQGKVLVRVLIGTDGSAQKADIKQSSGFDRLDQAALATVQKWRYVPGKRGGVPETMWFVVPINFVLE